MCKVHESISLVSENSKGITLDEGTAKIITKLEGIRDEIKGYIDSEEGTGDNIKPKQMHHFATNKNRQYTQRLKNIINKYGLDLEGDWNKALMPHQGRHPNEYHEYILDFMRRFDRIACGDANKFLELFENIKQKIISNPEMLTKKYWK